MILAEAGLAPEARVLAQAVARLALESLGLNDLRTSSCIMKHHVNKPAWNRHLTRGLMLELVVLAEHVVAVAAAEDPAAVLPHAALALDADGVLRSGKVRNWCAKWLTDIYYYSRFALLLFGGIFHLLPLPD